MRHRHVLALMLTLLVVPLSGALAQSGQVSDEWDAIAQESAGEVLEILARRSGSEFEMVRIDAGALWTGESDTREFRGTNNGFFAITGICDGNCSDIDLSLVDGAGQDLGADVEPDKNPTLDLVTGAETYAYTISMHGCTVGPCEWAVFVVRELGSGSPEVSGEGMEGWNEQALRMANGYVEQLVASGESFELLDVITGRMWPGEGSAIDIEGTIDRAHLAVGVCDTDCRDIDLHVTDPSGYVVGEDLEPDAFPTVHFMSGNETYEISLTMHGCSVGPCEWAIFVLREPGSTP